eukprot:6183620-Pleurochrysis_carterae.AAC.1
MERRNLLGPARLGRFDWTDGEGVGVGRCDGEGEHGVVAVSLQQLDAHDARARAGREPDLRLMRVRLEQSLVDATAAANWPTALVRNVFGLRLPKAEIASWVRAGKCGRAWNHASFEKVKGRLNAILPQGLVN